jgi:hypothetical protein
MEVKPPKAVEATTVLLSALQDESSPFEVLEDFHPAFADSITLVHQESGSAITFVIVESADKED